MVAALWIVTRVALLALLGIERSIRGDVNYYYNRVSHLTSAGLGRTLIEYPTPVVWLLSIPYWLTGGGRPGYTVGFVVSMMLLDAVLTWLLVLRGGHRGARGVLFWIFFVFLIGPLCYFRFDMIPAVLAGAALLLLSRRPGVAGALIGLGAAVKLWPALLLPAVLGKRAGVKRAFWSFCATGGGLALISLLVGGWARLVSPLTWQSGRGLQVEALWATPIMVWRAIDPTLHDVSMSKYQAFEIFGPGVDAMVKASDVLTVVGLATIVALSARVLWKRESSMTTAALLMTSIVAIMIITNKTLSPQYVLWLGGPIAVMLLGRRVDQDRPGMRRPVLGLSILALAIAALTQLIYPLTYGALVYDQTGRPVVIAVSLLAARNIGLVVLTIWAVVLTWRSAGIDPPR